ncbi:putative aldo/keto reductase family protein [Lyophyllum shimeji]|uniref:Aldo/keto reductase family protein n=1 Tax=Lyophyllum shimeji TaxID=47721 RepID=A0A9P3PKR2_LYOSH|nr:putative aldo/keto reductase family protein [Lyophyllum shimeji]
MTDILSFKLLDGTSIPWLACGNGSGQANKVPVEGGMQALANGIRHIDTAQIYGTEEATGQVVAASGIPKDEIYVTSKRTYVALSLPPDRVLTAGSPYNTVSALPNDQPVPLDQVRASVEESVRRLGFVPDLFLVHNPFVAPPGQLKALWKIFEELKSEGKLKSIGVSNFRPQDLEAILEDAKFKPVVNQIEYHPYTLTHLQPVLELQAKHGILTESYGPLTPILRHATGGPLKPVLERIAERLIKVTGKTVDLATVLLLWTRAQGAVAVTASGNADRIKALADVSRLPDLLEPGEVEEITRVGKTVHFRHYVCV